MTDSRPLFLANQPIRTDRAWPIADKFNGKLIAQVSLADLAMVEHAIAAAVQAAEPMRNLPAHRRQSILQHIVDQLTSRAEEFARMICAEAGKPIKDSRTEVTRAIHTFQIAAEEATRIGGEYLPLDLSARSENTSAIVKRVPIGPCSFITPFNFPLNLVAHKVAPAIAAGCPFVLKPAPQTPISSLMLGEILADTDLPKGAFSILPCEVEDAAALVEDDRLKLLSFTGSAAVGWSLKSKAGKKNVILELGGNAACIVDREVEVPKVVERLVFGAFYQSGQSCVSVQRIVIHESIYDAVVSRLVEAARKLVIGDPHDEKTFLGPLISEKDTIRVETWINEAVAGGRGAKVLCGGNRDRAFLPATVVENVPAEAKLSCEEAFGPVVIVEPFTDFAEACARCNRSKYGLQAGVFTNDLRHAWLAFEQLEVGSVILNDVPAFRVDAMPYGGVKDSGLGREGVKYAIEEMTERRGLVIRG